MTRVHPITPKRSRAGALAGSVNKPKKFVDSFETVSKVASPRERQQCPERGCQK